MLIIRRYKKNRSGHTFWEYRITFKDVFTNKVKVRKKGGYLTRDEALVAATDLMGYLRLPVKDIITRG